MGGGRLHRQLRQRQWELGGQCGRYRRFSARTRENAKLDAVMGNSYRLGGTSATTWWRCGVWDYIHRRMKLIAHIPAFLCGLHGQAEASPADGA